jgi:L-threonylcarbamoyladenylate synthase
MEELWPGPLTLIFKARPGLSSLLTGGTSTIGIRISSHPLAQHLASCAGGVITATSANLSGRPPAISAGEIAAQFEHGLDLILDGGKTAGGKPSTILALEDGGPVLLREGMVAADEIRRILAGRFPGQPL